MMRRVNFKIEGGPAPKKSIHVRALTPYQPEFLQI